MELPITYAFFVDLPPEPLLASLLDLHTRIFTGQTHREVINEITYHRDRGSLLLHVARMGERVIGYKAGYERKVGHFYSWLGCVDPAYRGQGIASALMRQQHDWCRQQGYHTIRTQTYNQWRGMLILNLKHDFAITGIQQGTRGLLILLEKRLLPAH